jgi:hypothetical protein
MLVGDIQGMAGCPPSGLCADLLSSLLYLFSLDICHHHFSALFCKCQGDGKTDALRSPGN